MTPFRALFTDKRPSLVRRLVVLAAGWIVLALVLTGIALSAYFRYASLGRFQVEAAELAEALYVEATIDDGEIVPPPTDEGRASRVYSGKYWQIAEVTQKGKIVPRARSRSLWDQTLKAPEDGIGNIRKAAGKPFYYDSLGPQRQPLRVVAIYSYLPGKAEPLVFMAAVDMSPLEKDARQFDLMIWLSLILLGAGLVAAVVTQVRIGLRPLFQLGQEVAQVRQGGQSRLEAVYPQEVEALTTELNALLLHNQDVVERQRTHVGNLAHALKTPIAVLTAEASGKADALSLLVLKQADVMKGQVEHHLRRARAAARSQALGEHTPVEPVIDELAVTLEQVFQAKGVEIDWRCPEALEFLGERQDLMEVVGNVMENAGKWCKRRVRVSVTRLEKPASSPGGGVGAGTAFLRIEIEDDGPGLAPEDRAIALKRGQRLDETAPGTGLGLSIVDELVRAYRGHLELDDARLGGLLVRIDLPAKI